MDADRAGRILGPTAVAVIVVVAVAVGGAEVIARAFDPAPAVLNSRPGGVPSMTDDPVVVGLTPTQVEARLRTLDPGFSLAELGEPRVAGVFPQLAYRGSTTSVGGIGRMIGRVMVYPTTAERERTQPAFTPSSINGPEGGVTWDGVVHSEWVGVQNVLVEVLVPGGTYGGSPTPEELGYPQLVRETLTRG